MRRFIGGVLLGLGLVALIPGCRIWTKDEWSGPIGREDRGFPHAGSGILVGPSGHVLTTSAVCSGARKLYVIVCLQERRTRYSAAVVAEDPDTGLVLLKIRAPLRWLLPWTHGSERQPLRAHVLGWPLLAAAEPGLHEVEISAAAGLLDGTTLSIPLSPGYEGGAVVDDCGDGLGIVSRVSSGGRLSKRATIVPAEAVRRFLTAHGVAPRPAVGYLKRPWRIRLRQLQNCVAQIERVPAREAPMPRLVRRTPLPADDILSVHVPNNPRYLASAVTVDIWKAPHEAQEFLVDPGTGSVQRLQDIPPGSVRPKLVFPRVIEHARGRYRLDSLGGLVRTDPVGSAVTHDLGALNGFRRFRSRDAFQLSWDNRYLLVGDAVVWTDTGTVLWRLSVRPTEPVCLTRDSSGLVIARRFGGYRRQLEWWQLPDVR